MKKVGCVLTLIIILMLCTNNVFAAENPSYGIELSASKTTVNPGDEITITLKLKDFKNMKEGLYAYLATIKYDNTFFETLTVTSVNGLGIWAGIPTFNPQNGMITAESSTGVKTESDVFSITFKVKENVEEGKSAQIEVTGFEASEGDVDIVANADAKITINVAKKQNNNIPEDNNTTGNNNTSGDKKPTNTDKENTSSNKLPQTGENDIIIFSIIAVVVVVAIGGYIGNKKYKNI